MCSLVTTKTALAVALSYVAAEFGDGETSAATQLALESWSLGSQKYHAVSQNIEYDIAAAVVVVLHKAQRDIEESRRCHRGSSKDLRWN